MQIGEGELSDAIDTLNDHLKTVGGDLYNQAIHLKGSFKEYVKNRDLGLGDNREDKSRISMAVLNLASEIEEQQVKVPPIQTEAQQQFPKKSAAGNQLQTPQNIAQCIFTMDTMQYFLNQNGQIFMVNPFSNQSVLVGMKMPSQNQKFAWTLYFSTTNVFYLVDHAGVIWGQNYGMPAQYGTVKYF